MNKPSIKSLDSAFPGKGKALRKLLDSETAVRANSAAIKLARRCYNEPKLQQLRLEALNDVAGAFGVEYVPAGHNARSPAFEYLNTGDTYTATIIRFAGGRYIVGDIGSIIERGNYD